jgi:hypothetical protein
MKAKNWVSNDTKNKGSKGNYEKAFELLHIKSDTMKKNFRTLGEAIVNNDTDTVNAVINYFKTGSSREITPDEIDRLKFIAEVSERGPEEMVHHQLYETYFPKEPTFDHVKKVPTNFFNWRDSQGVIRNKKLEYKPSHNPKDRGLCGKLS